jgi:hypothetical protein
MQMKAAFNVVVRPLSALSFVVAMLGVLAVASASAAAEGDANQSHCSPETESSPGFRSYLPDCRAYEMATPMFKDGTQLQLKAIAEDGSSALVETLGTFAALRNNTSLAGGYYELSRSPSGWTTEAIDPPSSLLPVQAWVAASPELTSTLWLGRTTSEPIAAENLYVLEQPGGTPVEIGSLIPPDARTGPPSGEFDVFLWSSYASYADASDDLSHVLFRLTEGKAHGISWPGDESTGLSSLYAYSGVGQARPELVGINDDGHQISTCATWLGSDGSRDIYNALSADGATVFFTTERRGECPGSSGPEVSELYARVDGRETVPISEPSAVQCAACITPGTVAEGRGGAEFTGASQDGSKVFFLTSQELLPGAVGMNLYEYDFDAPVGSQVSLVSSGASPAEVQGVVRVSEDGSRVYFVAHGRLGEGPRGGQHGPCLAELAPGELLEEEKAEAEEAKSEVVTTGARCRPVVGRDNLYVAEAGHVSFIATLSNGDRSDWGTNDSRPVQTTRDGRFLIFLSTEHLTAGDTASVGQLFEYDAVTGELVRVSRGREGYIPEAKLSTDRNEPRISIQSFSKTTTPTEANKLAVSEDGATVVFTDEGALTVEAEKAATANVESAYEYHSSVASGGSISAGSVYLLSGESTVPGGGVDGMDASAQDVLFETAASLVPQDTDTGYDIYDARVEGGFPAPDPPAGCVASACETPLVVAPVVGPGGSESVSGMTPAVASVPVVGVGRPGVAVLTRKERLARALKACTRVRRKRRRVACESAALRRYGRRAKAKKTSRESK